MAEGIEVRHRNSCRSLNGGRCSCSPTYRASAWSNRDQRRIRKSFPTLAAAKAWRSDAQSAIRKGTMKAPVPTTIREAWDAWLDGAHEGTIRNRSGDIYKAAAIRGYEKAMRREVLPILGSVRLTELRVIDVQDFVDGLMARGLAPSTIGTAMNPLRAIYRRALNRGEVAINPTRGVELPAVKGGRERIAPQMRHTR